MARAKAQGKHIARPPIAKQMQEKIIELQREGVGVHQKVWGKHLLFIESPFKITY